MDADDEIGKMLCGCLCFAEKSIPVIMRVTTRRAMTSPVVNVPVKRALPKAPPSSLTLGIRG